VDVEVVVAEEAEVDVVGKVDHHLQHPYQLENHRRLK